MDRKEVSPQINTEFLERCVETLDHAFTRIGQLQREDTLYDIFRAACVKEFELVLEQGGKLLRKRLRPWFASNRDVDRLTFKNLFRHAAKHGLINTESCERWLSYRDHRNNTAHLYGEALAEATLKLLPEFIADARELTAVISTGEEE